MIRSGEIVIILIAALVVFGPKRLLGLGSALDKVMHEFNKAMCDVKVKMDTEYEETGKRTKDEADELSPEKKITKDQTESKDKGWGAVLFSLGQS